MGKRKDYGVTRIGQIDVGVVDTYLELKIAGK